MKSAELTFPLLLNSPFVNGGGWFFKKDLTSFAWKEGRLSVRAQSYEFFRFKYAREDVGEASSGEDDLLACTFRVVDR